MQSKSLPIYAFFTTMLLLHITFAVMHWPLRAQWTNVPPVPSEHSSKMVGIGDAQFAYRFYATIIQNMGDSGGRVTSLQDYDFDRLGRWFFLEDYLDPRSNMIPMLAAYYYGGTQNPDQLDPVIDYLTVIGQRTYDQKWRWLAHAAYLARFNQHDLDKALKLALMLSALNIEDLPVWAKHMPTIIENAKGDKETAYNIFVSILKDEHQNLHPTEVNFIVHYVCEQVLSPMEAAVDPLCKDYD